MTRRALGVLVATLQWGSAIPGCADAEPPVVACSERKDCPLGYACDPAAGLCVDERECTDPSDCCPGALCLLGTCRTMKLCASDIQCAADDGVCDRGVCTAAACTTNTGCKAPYVCLGGHCSPRLPCDGCSADQVCEPLTKRCLARTAACDPTACESGSVALVNNLEAMRGAGPQCDPAIATCQCVPLPGLAAPRLGGRLALARIGDSWVAFGRDGRYGDLVAGLVEPGQAVKGVIPIAGVPVGPVVANPTGPRDGIAAPGPDLGRYVNAVSLGDSAAVLTMNATAGELVFARVGIQGGVLTVLEQHRVDTELASGYGATLARTADGALHAAWFTRRSDGVESLRYALASGAGVPTSPTDWTRSVITSGPQPAATALPCNGGCGTLQVCIESDAGPSCVTSSLIPACDPACDRTSLCIDDTCRKQLRRDSGLRQWRDHPGSTAAVAGRGSEVILAWYDRPRGALRLGAGTPGVDFQHSIRDGGRGDDVGRGVRLAANDAAIAAVYRDASRGVLRVLYGTDVDSLVPHTVEPGGRGADVALTADGALVIAHGTDIGDRVRLIFGVPGAFDGIEPLSAVHIGRFNALQIDAEGLMLLSLRDQLAPDLSPAPEGLTFTLPL